MACYVVLAPEPIRGICDTWPLCEQTVSGVSGAVYRKVADLGTAEALLRGEGRKLDPGTYAFIDGNAAGGIGVVLVHRKADGSTVTREISTTVAEKWPPLARDVERFRNPLVELLAAQAAFDAVHPGTTLTVVHDYEGTSAWIEGRWRLKDGVIGVQVIGCRATIHNRGLHVRFQHQPGHQSDVGGDEYAAYNAKADALATQAVA